MSFIQIHFFFKYFKFKFLPWNASSSASNENLIKVLTILGIDKQDNFAIYDLFALLVIFLHRTILKRLGLWRDFLDDDELLLATNEEDKKTQKKELMEKIDTNIYREPSPDDPSPSDEVVEVETPTVENDKLERKEEGELDKVDEDADVSGVGEEADDENQAELCNNDQEKENLNELENVYNCLIDDEDLVQDPVEKEKLRERIKEKIEIAKK